MTAVSSRMRRVLTESAAPAGADAVAGDEPGPGLADVSTAGGRGAVVAGLLETRTVDGADGAAQPPSEVETRTSWRCRLLPL